MVFKKLKQILGYEVPNIFLVLYLYKYSVGNGMASDRYLIKFLPVDSKKPSLRTGVSKRNQLRTNVNNCLGNLFNGKIGTHTVTTRHNSKKNWINGFYTGVRERTLNWNNNQ